MIPIEKAADLIRAADHIIALTGAGLSVESGIPPFRGKGGLWEKFDPMTYANIKTFLADPAEVWRVFVNEMRTTVARARPNAGHLALARMEKNGFLDTVVTQNIDGLHQAAGSQDVIELHGNFVDLECLECHSEVPASAIDWKEIPPRCSCGGIYRPQVVFFGEMLPAALLSRAMQLSGNCDLMLIIGTSATVTPAALLPLSAKNNGARLIEVNPTRTDLSVSSDVTIQAPAGEALSALVSLLEKGAS